MWLLIIAGLVVLAMIAPLGAILIRAGLVLSALWIAAMLAWVPFYPDSTSWLEVGLGGPAILMGAILTLIWIFTGNRGREPGILNRSPGRLPEHLRVPPTGPHHQVPSNLRITQRGIEEL